MFTTVLFKQMSHGCLGVFYLLGIFSIFLLANIEQYHFEALE